MGKQLSEHFNSDEFRCKCGCGVCDIAAELIPALEDYRALVSAHLGKDTPLVILSGYRCPAHNKAVGGAKDSQHMQGKAADVMCPEGITTESFARLAENVPAFRNGGIGVYPPVLPTKKVKVSTRPCGWVHTDVRDGKARWAG